MRKDPWESSSRPTHSSTGVGSGGRCAVGGAGEDAVKAEIHVTNFRRYAGGVMWLA